MITTMTPSSENIRGTSALPYHLIKGRSGTSYENEMLTLRNAFATKNEVEIEIYTFNNNKLSDEKIAEVERELGVTIKKVPLPKWFLFIFKYRLLFIRVFLNFPIHHYVKLPQRYVDEIKAQKPDLIWVYGAEWSRVVNQFDGYQRIHTLPDSEALYYYRMLGQRFVTHDWKRFWRCALMYPKFLALERNYSTDPSIRYHLVGEADAEFLRRMNPGIRAEFLRHPHYEVKEERGERREERKFHQPKIKVLIAGQYNYYMKQSADELIEFICRYEDETFHYENESYCRGFLQEHYSITFLGKGWEKHVERMRQAGYEVAHITFAPDYIEEISKHDIQITPIAIGTGTKGKVLDALANGLLVIGTPYAMENIAVEHGKSCIVYEKPQEVVDVLMDIVKGNVNEKCEDEKYEDEKYENNNNIGNVEKYERMAAEGQRQVLKWHDRARIASQLFNIETT